MKKIVKQRSLEERASFFKKNLHRAGLGSSGGNENKPKIEKPEANVHELIEEAIETENMVPVEEPTIVEETVVVDEVEVDDLDFGDDDLDLGDDDDENDDDDDNDDNENDDDDDDEFDIDL